jgi:hypothetical protein
MPKFVLCLALAVPCLLITPRALQADPPIPEDWVAASHPVMLADAVWQMLRGVLLF